MKFFFFSDDPFHQNTMRINEFTLQIFQEMLLQMVIILQLFIVDSNLMPRAISTYFEGML